MALTSSVREGFIPFRGYRTWYRLIGDFTPTAEGTFPLLTLHGGPGIPHDSLEPLEELAETGRPVIFYDLLGCGNSDCPDDPSLWKVNLLLEKITAVRHHLTLDQIHLLGHSWGGALALEYALTQPNGLISLTIASSFANAPRMLADRQRVYEQLPSEVREILPTQPPSDDLAYI